MCDCENDYSRLRGRIVEKFENQKNFAMALGMTESYVSHVLRGIANPTQKSIYRWAAVLGIGKEEIGEYFFSFESCQKETEGSQ